MIENYKLTEEQAESIAMFYHPELAEADLPKGISCVEHNFDTFPPTFRCKVKPGVQCVLKLRTHLPLIEYVEIKADDDSTFKLGKQRLEEIFGFELN